MDVKKQFANLIISNCDATTAVIDVEKDLKVVNAAVEQLLDNVINIKQLNNPHAQQSMIDNLESEIRMIGLSMGSVLVKLDAATNNLENTAGDLQKILLLEK